MSELRFRPAKTEDLEAVIQITLDATKELLEMGIRQWNYTYPLMEDYENDVKEKTLIIGEKDGRIAVFYTLNKTCDESYLQTQWLRPDVPFRVMHRFIVAPEFQRRGIGYAALEDMEQRLLSQGVCAIRLEAYAHNPISVHMYEKAGYRRAREVTFTDGREFILMEKYFD